MTPPPTLRLDPLSRDEEQAFKFLLKDAVFDLLRHAAARPGIPPEHHTAQALSDLFDGAPLTVLWTLRQRGPEGPPTRIRVSGAQVAGVDAPPGGLAPEAVHALLDALPDLTPPTASVQPRPLQVGDRWWLCLQRRPRSCLIDLDEQLWIGLHDLDGPDRQQRLRHWLGRYTLGLREFFLALKALHALEHRARLERRIEALVLHRRPGPLAAHLDEAQRLLLERVYELGCDEPQLRDLTLAARLGGRVVSQVLGMGWLSRDDTRADDPRLAQLAHALTRASLAVPADADPPASDEARPTSRRTRLRTAAHRLRAMSLLLSDDPDRPSPSHAPDRWREAVQGLPLANGHDATWWLLVVWTRVHRAAEAIRGAPDDPRLARALDDTWTLAAQGTAHRVQILFAEPDPPLDRPRLAIWLAQRLLPLACGTSLLDAERHALRTRLAWVVRESARALVFGHHADFVWQPVRFAEAMLDLVEHHLHDMLGLPATADLRGHLSELARPTGAHDVLLTAEHRQHVLEICLAGQFLLEMRRPDGQGAWSPSGHAPPDGLRQAFALAALLHDVGVLVLSRLRTALPWSQALPLPMDRVEALRQAHDTQATSLLTALVEEVRQALGPDLAADDAPLWRVQGDQADHGVVSAWVLLHLLGDAGLDDLLQPALWAILLHGDPGLPLSAAEDPVAALLVLCDQLYDWEPWGAVEPDLHQLGDDHHRLAPALARAPSRAQAVRLDPLELTVDPSHDTAAPGTLVPRLRPSSTWPRFRLHLGHAAPHEGIPAPWRTWLSVSQNLGRIDTTRRASWDTELVLEVPRSPAPPAPAPRPTASPSSWSSPPPSCAPSPKPSPPGSATAPRPTTPPTPSTSTSTPSTGARTSAGGSPRWRRCWGASRL